MPDLPQEDTRLKASVPEGSPKAQLQLVEDVEVEHKGTNYINLQLTYASSNVLYPLT